MPWWAEILIIILNILLGISSGYGSAKIVNKKKDSKTLIIPKEIKKIKKQLYKLNNKIEFLIDNLTHPKGNNE
ncbi:hypothetical protein SPE_1128 [Spiroplasma eriocheiris CCTCC M 207170]|nr:hypothetical protein SPE_1128 [Spiroplasma eriocheiris CCTCC M 207170]